MSTKIYGGRKINSTDLFYINSIIDKIRTEYFSQSKSIFIKTLSSFVVKDIIDRISVEKDPILYSLSKYDFNLTKGHAYSIEDYLDKIRFNLPCLIDESQKRDFDWDFSYTISLYPTSNQCTLLIINSEQEELYKIISKMPEIKYYPYWDNTDRPENVSEEDWDKRSDEWDSVLSAGKIGSINFEIKNIDIYLPNFYHKMFDAIIENQPSLEDRLRNVAKDSSLEEYIKSSKTLTSDKIILDHNFTRLLINHQDYLETKEGKAKLEEKKNFFRNKLLPAISKEHLKSMSFVPLKMEEREVDLKETC